MTLQNKQWIFVYLKIHTPNSIEFENQMTIVHFRNQEDPKTIEQNGSSW